MSGSPKLRLDQLLVERYGYESRSRARDAVLRGCVMIDGRTILKPGQTVDPETPIVISDDAENYVSRAALKLVKALDAAQIDVSGMVALDLGASTGGFTQVLLERGARHVHAIDVGSGQLHQSLASDERVTNIENLNVRDLTADDLGNHMPQIVTGDLSFISLKLALPPALELADNGAWGVFLIKPQFEVGKMGLGSGGIVRDEKLITQTVEDLRTWLDGKGSWSVLDILPSPIEGGDGNREFLMIARKGSANG